MNRQGSQALFGMLFKYNTPNCNTKVLLFTKEIFVGNRLECHATMQLLEHNAFTLLLCI
jgi:hypothetical protein